jgi:hypothetical protein
VCGRPVIHYYGELVYDVGLYWRLTTNDSSYNSSRIEVGLKWILHVCVGLVNERPDVNNPTSNSNNNWSENGDRYILKVHHHSVCVYCNILHVTIIHIHVCTCIWRVPKVYSDQVNFSKVI